jgi:hypothetical protein
VSVVSPTSSVPSGASGSASGNAASSVKTGSNTKATQDKKTLEIAGEVLNAVKDKATEDAGAALESENSTESANLNHGVPNENDVESSAANGTQNSSNRAPLLFVMLALLLLAAFVTMRMVTRKN